MVAPYTGVGGFCSAVTRHASPMSVARASPTTTSENTRQEMQQPPQGEAGTLMQPPRGPLAEEPPALRRAQPGPDTKPPPSLFIFNHVSPCV